jgi:tetratricopeptide (TPR) repeat protein
VADPLLASEYHFRLGLTQFFLGDHAQSQLAAQEALREAERSGDAEHIGKALHVLSLGAFEGGRPHDGIAQAVRAIAALDHPKTQAWLALAYHDLALNCILAGTLDAAIDAATKEEAIGRESQWPRAQALGGYVIAWALALRRDDELAVETAHRALELARDPMVASLVSGTLGYAHLERGDAPSAVTFLTQAIDQLQSSPLRQGEVRHMAILSEALLLAGDAARARETAARALELSEADGMIFNVGIAQRAAGRIAYAGGELGEAEGHLSQALTTFTESGAAFEAARTRLDLAAVDAKRGDKNAAREHLSAALAVFEAANAPKRAAHARDLAQAWGVVLDDG